MAEPEPRISDDDARALWRRAAELQAAAERGRLPARKDPAGSSQDFTLEQVAAAAEGAGIDPDYVRVALAERRLPDGHEVRRDRWTARWLRRIVGEEDAIEVTRTIAAPGERVLSAFHKVAHSAPYALTLESRLGREPVGDTVHAYRLSNSSVAASPFQSALNLADVRVLLVRVRASGERAELRIRAPLFRRGINLAAGGTSAGLLGAGGGWTGVTLATALGVATSTMLLAPAIAGAMVGGAVGLAGYRRLYHGLVRNGEAALNTLLTSVELETENAAHVLESRSPR